MTYNELEFYESIERDLRRFSIFGKPDPYPRECSYASPVLRMKDLIAFDEQKAAYTLKENEEWRTLPNGVHVVINIKSGYTHELDVHGIRHAFNHHGDPKAETNRGQVALTEEDFKKIPFIIKHYDSVKYAGKTHKGLDILEYRKQINGTVVYIEEIRTGRKTLTVKTMWKHRR
jgi:hypothetical protein